MSNPPAVAPEAIPLHDWRVVPLAPGQYASPLHEPIALAGRVKPGETARWPAGAVVCSSQIVSVAGRVVATISGLIYLLKEADRGYREQIQERGIVFDPESPTVAEVPFRSPACKLYSKVLGGPARITFSLATIDAARDWLNNGPRAAEYAAAADERAAEMLAEACAEIEDAEASERARVARQERP